MSKVLSRTYRQGNLDILVIVNIKAFKLLQQFFPAVSQLFTNVLL